MFIFDKVYGSNLGMDGDTKSDEFPKGEGVGRVIFNPKVHVADFGNFKQGFLSMEKKETCLKKEKLPLSYLWQRVDPSCRLPRLIGAFRFSYFLLIFVTSRPVVVVGEPLLLVFGETSDPELRTSPGRTPAIPGPSSAGQFVRLPIVGQEP